MITTHDSTKAESPRPAQDPATAAAETRKTAEESADVSATPGAAESKTQSPDKTASFAQITAPSEHAPPGYKFHKAASLLPLMSPEEFVKLVASIRTHGLREPIRRYKGEILDGRNRLWGCIAAGVEPEFIDIDDKDIKGSATEYVVDLNVERRHLSSLQRAVFAADCVDELPPESKDKPKATRRPKSEAGSQGTPDPQGDEPSPSAKKEAARSTNRAAKAWHAGISATKKLLSIKNNNPAVFAEVKAGKIASVAEAERLAGTAGSTAMPVTGASHSTASTSTPPVGRGATYAAAVSGWGPQAGEISTAWMTLRALLTKVPAPQMHSLELAIDMAATADPIVRAALLSRLATVRDGAEALQGRTSSVADAGWNEHLSLFISLAASVDGDAAQTARLIDKLESTYNVFLDEAESRYGHAS